MTEPTSCTNCGSPLASGAKFCGSCGQTVAAAPPAAAPAASDATTPPSRRNRTLLVIAAAAVLVIGAAGAGVGWAVSSASSSTAAAPDADAPEPAPDADEPEPVVVAETATPSPTPTPTAEPLPALTPTQAPITVETRQFRSPSGNIRCTIQMYQGHPAAICQLENVNFPIPSTACQAGGSGVFIGVYADSGTFWPCVNGNIEPLDTLPLDTPYTWADITCTINQVTGVRCTNLASHGFTLEYDRSITEF